MPEALHRQPWLRKCAKSASFWRVDPALSGSYLRERENLLYYRHLRCVALRYAAHAETVLDVGSARPPFVNLLEWVPNRTILGPYFVGASGSASVARSTASLRFSTQFAK